MRAQAMLSRWEGREGEGGGLSGKAVVFWGGVKRKGGGFLTKRVFPHQLISSIYARW